MNVCMIAYTFYEGDNRVRRYAETLVKRGDRVDAICLQQPGSRHYAKVAGVSVYKIQPRTINERFKIEYLLKLLVFLIKSAYYVTKLNFKKKYDVIHVHSVPDFEVFATFIPKLTGAKIILDIHDIVPELFASKFKSSKDSILFKALLLVERASMAFSDHVIVANHIWYERLINRSVGQKKCSVVMNYPDPSIFKPKEIEKNNNKFTIVYPGTLSYHQGIETAIRAIDIVKEHIPEIEFHIYGKGTDEGYFVNLVKELNLEKKVFFNQIVPIEKLPDIYATADIGIEPKIKNSFSNEAFSTKILEFMLMGVPVIVSDTKVHTHYFNKNIVHFFKSEDEKDLARCILEMKNEKRTRDMLVENAFKFMMENTWDAKKHLYLEIVDSLFLGRQ